MNKTTSSPEEHARLLRLATRTSLVTALLLMIIKLGGWWVTDSVSLLASLLDSSADLVASALTFIAVRWSLIPPDHDHRFGHGKAEALAALAQAMFILGSGVMLGLQGIERLISPQPLVRTDVGLLVMMVSIALTLALVAFQYGVVRRTGSTAIRADALHYATDLLTNIAVIFALLLSQWGVLRADALLGLLIAGYVAWSAVKIARQATHQLMDRELSDEVVDEVRRIALGVDGVDDVAKLRTRQSGSVYLFEIYIVLDSSLSLLEAHTIGNRVSAAIRARFPMADVTVHEEPACVVR